MKKVVVCFFILAFLGFNIFIVGGDQISLTEIGEIYTGSRTVGVHVEGDILYALDLEQGLKIYNISDPTSPKELGSFRNLYTFSHAFCYTNGLLLIADYEDKLEVVNVSDPLDPQLIGHYREVDYSVEHFGSTNLYNMEIIDISDPENPIKIGHYYFGKSINVVYANGNLAFIREMGGSFKILDITNLTNPLEIYHCTEVRMGQNFFVMNDLLYIPDSNFGLRIFDISDHSNTFKIGEKQIDSTCRKCVVENRGTNTYAYVSAEEKGLIILDVTDPENIKEIGGYDDGGQSFDLFIQDDLIFIAEFESGLEILELTLEETTQSGLSLGFNVYFLISGFILMLTLKRRIKL
ncbi:MAG: LVIVD repeat-containing protein [Candidatus Hodarchaeota archaeon]